MTEKQQKQIDDLVQLWKNMPEGKLVLIKDGGGDIKYHVQQGGKIEDCPYPQITRRITEIELLTNIL